MKKLFSTFLILFLLINQSSILFSSTFASTPVENIKVFVSYPISDEVLGVTSGDPVHEPVSGIKFRFSLQDNVNTLCIEEASLPVINGHLSYQIGSQYYINFNGVASGCNMSSLTNLSGYSITVTGDLNKDGDFSDPIDFTSSPATWTEATSGQFDNAFLDETTSEVQSSISLSVNGGGISSSSEININEAAGLLSTELISQNNKVRSFDIDKDGIGEVFSRGGTQGIIYSPNDVSGTYENIYESSLITLEDETNIFANGKDFNFVLHGTFGGNPIKKNNIPVTIFSTNNGGVSSQSYTLFEVVLGNYFIISLSGENKRFTFNPTNRIYEQDLSITFGDQTGLFDSTTSSDWNGTPFANDSVDYFGGDIREGEVNGEVVSDSDGIIYGDFNNDERLDFISYKNQSGGNALFSIYLQNKDGTYKMILDEFLGDGISAGTSIVDNGLQPRYIRDHANRSNRNYGTHFIEVEAIDFNGINQAYGKDVTMLLTVDPNRPVERITDGNTSGGNYTQSLSYSPNHVTVDLGSNFDIEKVNVWHYYPDGGTGRYYFDTKTEISEDGTNWYSLYDSALQGTYIEPKDGSGVSHINSFADTNEFIITSGKTKNIFSINWGWENNATGIGVNNTVTQIASFDSTFYSVLSEDGGTENVDNGFFAIGDGFSDMAEGNRDSEYLLVGNYMLNKDGLDYYDYKIKRYDGTSFIDLPLQSSGAPFRGIGNRISFVKAGNSDFNLFYIDQSSENSRNKQDLTTLYYVYNNEVVKLGDFIVNPNNTISSQDGLGNEGGSKLLTNSTFGFNGDNISDISSGYFGIPKENYVSGNFNFTVEDSWIDMRDVTTAGATLTGNVTLNDKFIRNINIAKGWYTSNSRYRCGGAEQLDISLNGNLSYDLSITENKMYQNNPSNCGDINLEVNKHYDSFSIDHILTSSQNGQYAPINYSTLTINYSEFSNEKEYFQVNNGNVVNFNSGTFDYGDILSTSSSQGTVFRLSDLNMSDTGLQNLINTVSTSKNSYVQDSINRIPPTIWYLSNMDAVAKINNRYLNGYSSPVLNQSTILSNKDNVFLVIDKGEIGFISNNLTNLSPGIYRDNILGTHIGFIRNNTIDTGIRIGIPEPVSRPLGLIKWNASWLQPGYHGTGTNGDTTWVVNLFNNSGGNVVGTTSTDNYTPPAPYNVRLQPNTTASESVVWGNMGMSIDY